MCNITIYGNSCVCINPEVLGTVCNQEAGQPGKLATDFLQVFVLHKISKL